MESKNWQTELLSALQEQGLDRDDLLSVLFVLSTPEKGEEMLHFLKENPSLSPEAIRQKAGEIAFGEKA